MYKIIRDEFDNSENMIKCDDELIGKNSVIPCISDKNIISIIN